MPGKAVDTNTFDSSDGWSDNGSPWSEFSKLKSLGKRLTRVKLEERWYAGNMRMKEEMPKIKKTWIDFLLIQKLYTTIFSFKIISLICQTGLSKEALAVPVFLSQRNIPTGFYLEWSILGGIYSNKTGRAIFWPCLFYLDSSFNRLLLFIKQA